VKNQKEKAEKATRHRPYTPVGKVEFSSLCTKDFSIIFKVFEAGSILVGVMLACALRAHPKQPKSRNLLLRKTIFKLLLNGMHVF
jgi:hypothetical protein